MWSHQNLIKNRLYKLNQETMCYNTCKIDTLPEIMDTVKSFTIRATAVEMEIINTTLYYDMGKIKKFWL